MTKALKVPPGYAVLLKDIKERVRTAQVRAALAVNRELILLYWSIGRDISSRFDMLLTGMAIGQSCLNNPIEQQQAFVHSWGHVAEGSSDQFIF
jgi:hypothetical protein